MASSGTTEPEAETEGDKSQQPKALQSPSSSSSNDLNVNWRQVEQSASLHLPRSSNSTNVVQCKADCDNLTNTNKYQQVSGGAKRVVSLRPRYNNHDEPSTTAANSTSNYKLRKENSERVNNLPGKSVPTPISSLIAASLSYPFRRVFFKQRDKRKNSNCISLFRNTRSECNSSSTYISPIKSRKTRSSSFNRKHLGGTISDHVNRLISLIKMAPKRYYILLFCSSLVIIACLVASLAISRSVGELGDQGTAGSDSSETSNRMGQSLKLGPSEPDRVGHTPEVPHVMELLERRTLDLVDLMECGKTFAYVKIRAQVQVPKSSPIYKQQPSFLHAENSHGAYNKIESEQAAQSQQISNIHNNPAKLIMTQANIQLDNEASESAATETSSAESERLSKELLNQSIKPFEAVNGSQPNRSGSSSPISMGVNDLAALLAASTGSGGGLIEDSRDNLLMLADSSLQDPKDPLYIAASDLSLNLSTMNSSIVDCFIVDTDKRYNQKMALEDRHRLVASTRKVSFKRMMSIITGCRQLTWSSLPDPNAIKKVPQRNSMLSANLLEPSGSTSTGITSQVKSVDVVKPMEIPPTSADNGNARPVNDFFGTLLNSLFDPPQAGSQPAANDQMAAQQMNAAASQQQRQQLSNKVAQRVGAVIPNEDPRAQASYLNMGMSMVSGIVPNTLWCGLGDRAGNYSELGAEFRVDACCRAHDHCPIRLKPFTTDYGLINWSMSTRSHCDCDLDFNDCLVATNTTLSNLIRVLYFRFVGLQCIDVENRQAKEQAVVHQR